GLITYAHAFGDARAKTLAQGGLTTFLHAAQLVRHPGQVSGYSVSHQSPTPFYHGIVTGQLAVFSAVTGDTRFSSMSTNFSAYFPIEGAFGALEVSAGPQAVATANEVTLIPTDSKVVSLGASAHWVVNMRVRLQGREGYWYHLQDGPYANMFLLESANAYL